MIGKQELRKICKARRLKLKNERPEADRIIFEKLIREPVFLEANCIFCYVSYGSEIDTADILKYILQSEKTLVVPKCADDAGNMIAVKIESFSDLKTGMYGIKEPDSDISFDINNIDVAIVPGLAFDKNGFRLGYGKGYYDRFLRNNDIKTIGVCHKELVFEELPHSNFDVAMSKILTD